MNREPVFDINPKELLQKGDGDFRNIDIENTYDILSKRDCSQDIRVRALVEKLYANYPQAHCEKMLIRLRSGGPDFNGAFFELFLYNWLRNLGCGVEIDHPLERKETPDFRVTTPEGKIITFEATSVTGLSDKERGGKKREWRVWETVKAEIKVRKLRGFYLGMQIYELLRDVGKKKLIDGIVEWHKELDSNEVSTDRFDSDDRKLVYKEDGVRIVIRPIPFKKDCKSICTLDSSKWSAPGFGKKVLKNLEGKAKKYRDSLEHPYIIAVNVCPHLSLCYDKGVEEISKMLCACGGLWQDKHGAPRTEHVSAVLMADHLSPWDIDRPALLVTNPYAKRPFTTPKEWEAEASTNFQQKLILRIS